MLVREFNIDAFRLPFLSGTRKTRADLAPVPAVICALARLVAVRGVLIGLRTLTVSVDLIGTSYRAFIVNPGYVGGWL